jgi:hypothetical protein
MSCPATPALGLHRPARSAGVRAASGGPDAVGAFATCHCLTLPETEPGYYFWKDRATGELHAPLRMVRDQDPGVRVGATRIKYLDLVRAPALLRADAPSDPGRTELYGHVDPWVAKLDTIIHELYHIDPAASGPAPVRARGRHAQHSHATRPEFYEDVAR